MALPRRQEQEELSVVGNNALYLEKQVKNLEKRLPSNEERGKVQNILKRLDQLSTLQLTTPRLSTDFKLTEVMVNKKCSCISAPTDPDDEDDEKEDLDLNMVLTILERYKKIKGQRSSIALKLVKSFAANRIEETASPKNIQMIKDYLQHDNFLIKEGALLLIQSLASNFDNTNLIVKEGIINTCFTLIGDEKAKVLHPSVANTITSIVEKKELLEHWIDLFKTFGLATIITRFHHSDNEEVRVALLGLLAQLCCIREMALLILDEHWLPVLMDTSPTPHNLKTKEAGVRLLVNIAKHDPQQWLSCICQINGVLPLVLCILTLGTCKFQSEAVVFLQLLCRLSNGISVVIEDLLGFIMAALTSSGCRKVREACLLLLKKIFMTSTPYHTEQIWIELYHYQKKTATRVLTIHGSLETQGIVFLVRTLVLLFQQESKMRYDKNGELAVVGYQPGKDSYMALQYICEIFVAFCNLSNRTNSALKLCSTLQLLVDNGALSVIVDFLYSFNLKVFGRLENSVMEKISDIDLLHLHALLESWKAEKTPENYSQLADGLELKEIGFISELLQFNSLLAKSCVDSHLSQFEESINKRLCEENEEDKNDLTRTEAIQPDRHLLQQIDSTASGHTSTTSKLNTKSAKKPMREKFHQDTITRELIKVQCHIKTQQFKSGLIQSIRPFLLSNVEKWQVLSLEILRYTVQPLQTTEKKRKVKTSSNSNNSHYVQQRPKSSKTLAERDAMIQKTLQKKSESEHSRPQTAKAEAHSWKPVVDLEHPIMWQCMMEVVSVCTTAILYNTQQSCYQVNKAALFLLYDVAAHSEVTVHMKLIALGCVLGLIGVINQHCDKNPLLSFLGLIICQIMMCSDRRVREFFKKYGLDSNLRAILSSQRRDTSERRRLNREAALTLACLYSK